MPQQLARIDHIDRQLLGNGINGEIAEHAARLLAESDALLVSDYDIAAINAEVIAALRPVARERGCRVRPRRPPGRVAAGRPQNTGASHA